LKKLVSMREALADRQLLGAALPSDSWSTWRAILIALAGEELTKAERKVFKQFTGRDREPGEPIDTFLAVAGRRSGKTTAMAALVVYYACVVDWTEALSLGERGTALFLAPKQEQAQRAARDVRAFIKHSQIMSRLIENETQVELALSNGIDVIVEAANWRTVRGVTCVACCLDECAFLRNDEESTMRDEDLVTALRPSLVTTAGPMLLISSPGTDIGVVHAIHRRHYGPQGDPLVLVVQSDSRSLNPKLDQKRIDREYIEDPEAAQAEWGGQFRAPTTQYLPRHVIEAAVSPGVQERPPVKLPSGFAYHAFVDAAGGEGKDSFVLAIGRHSHEKRDHVVVDCVREWKPPFNSETVVAACAEVLRHYGIRGVAGDMYAKGWPTQAFARNGIEYREVNQSASDLYAHCIHVASVK
jgi:terminase large subunit-like protein